MNPLDGIKTYAEMLSGAGGIAKFFIVLVVIIFVAAIIFSIIRMRRKGDTKLSSEIYAARKAQSQAKITPDSEVIEKGHFIGICFRPGNIIDFITTMKEPIGESYQIGTSCPVSGIGSVVIENEKGELEDFDPRKIDVKVGETPEDAYDFIHWDDGKRFWTALVSMWKVPATWFCIVWIIGTIIFGAAVFD